MFPFEIVLANLIKNRGDVRLDNFIMVNYLFEFLALVGQQGSTIHPGEFISKF